jgi:hypothetical protein
MHQRREHEKGWITYMNIFKYSLSQNGLHNGFSIESLILQQEIKRYFSHEYYNLQCWTSLENPLKGPAAIT